MSPLISRDVTYYVMATQLHTPPHLVDQMDSEMVDSLMTLHLFVKEKEEKLMREARNA